MKCECVKESKIKYWQDGTCWGCEHCEHIAYGDAPDKTIVKIYPVDEEANSESNKCFHFRMYFRNAKTHRGGFRAYLGENALTQCENCDDVVEYDEVDERCYCLNCESEDE